MKKVFLSIISVLIFCSLGMSKQSNRFYIYRDAASVENHFCPTGWMGDASTIKNNFKDVQVMNKLFIQPGTGKQCMRITYTPQELKSWFGVYFLYDWKQDWDKMDNHYDLNNYKTLHFMAKGEKGGEIIELLKVGGIRGVYSDSADISLGGLMLTKKWHKYSYSLKGNDLSKINGGFMFLLTGDNGDQVIYLDEIYFE